MTSALEDTLLSFLYRDITRDFTDVFFHSFFNHTKCTYYYGYFHGFHTLLKVFASESFFVIDVLSFLFFTIMSGLFALISLSVWICMSYNIMISLFSVTVFESCSQHLAVTSISQCLHSPQWIQAAILPCLCVYSVFANSEQPGTRWSIVSCYLVQILHSGLVPSFKMLCRQ